MKLQEIVLLSVKNYYIFKKGIHNVLRGIPISYKIKQKTDHEQITKIKVD